MNSRSYRRRFDRLARDFAGVCNYLGVVDDEVTKYGLPRFNFIRVLVPVDSCWNSPILGADKSIEVRAKNSKRGILVEVFIGDQIGYGKFWYYSSVWQVV